MLFLVVAVVIVVVVVVVMGCIYGWVLLYSIVLFNQECHLPSDFH